MGDQTIDTYLAFLLYHGPGFVGLDFGEGVGAGVDMCRCCQVSVVGCRAGNVVDLLPLHSLGLGCHMVLVL